MTTQDSYFDERIYQYIAHIFETENSEMIPNSLIDLIFDYRYQYKYPEFDEDACELTLKQILMDYVRYLVDLYHDDLDPKFKTIQGDQLISPDDPSSTALLILSLSDEQIQAINDIKSFIHNIMRKDPNRITNYLKDNIEKYVS